MPWWAIFASYIGACYAFVGAALAGGWAWRKNRRPMMRARLEGGPFDGDTGALIAPPGVTVQRPGELHTVRCRAPRCAKGGVHWWADEETAREDARRNHTGVYRYLFARDDEVLVYVYAELTDGGRALLARERLPVSA